MALGAPFRHGRRGGLKWGLGKWISGPASRAGATSDGAAPSQVHDGIAARLWEVTARLTGIPGGAVQPA